MKFKMKFMESTTPRIVNAKNAKELSSYIMEKMDKLESLEPMFESVKVTPELVQKAWLELIRRARGKFVSTVALDSVCMDNTQNTDWDEPAGTDKFAFDKLYDILIAKLDEGHYELLDADEYDKKFNLDKGPQTSFDVRMNNIRRMNNASMRESFENWSSPKHKSGTITVPVKIVFEGEVYVDGNNEEIQNSEELAKAYVGNHFYSLLDKCEPEYGTENIIVDWDVETHGTTIPEGLE